MLTQALGPLFSSSRNPTPRCLEPDSPLASHKCWSQGDCGVKQHQKKKNLISSSISPTMREFSSQNHNGHRAIQVAISLLHLDELERGILVIIRAFYVRSPTCLLCCLDRKCTLCNQAFFFFSCKCRCVSLRRP